MARLVQHNVPIFPYFCNTFELNIWLRCSKLWVELLAPFYQHFLFNFAHTLTLTLTFAKAFFFTETWFTNKNCYRPRAVKERKRVAKIAKRRENGHSSEMRLKRTTLGNSKRIEFSERKKEKRWFGVNISINSHSFGKHYVCSARLAIHELCELYLRLFSLSLASLLCMPLLRLSSHFLVSILFLASR